MSIPKIGAGAFHLSDEIVFDSVRDALDLGYRAIDTGQIYATEAAVGQAIAESGVARSGLFITTKIWIENYTQGRLIPSLRESLEKLRTDYVDLTLIHWPAPGNGVPLSEFMTALAEAKAQGLTRQIGLSNFNIELTRKAIAVVGQGEIATNQIELHPYLQNRELAHYLQEQGITVTTYLALAYGKMMRDPVLRSIALKHKATATRVALAWALQQGYSVIPSSSSRRHLTSNLLACHLRLDAEDMARIAQLERNGREMNPEHLAPDWD